MEQVQLTCKHCQSAPTEQAVVIDWKNVGRETSLLCTSCANSTLLHAERIELIIGVWRFTLTPIPTN